MSLATERKRERERGAARGEAASAFPPWPSIVSALLPCGHVMAREDVKKV